MDVAKALCKEKYTALATYMKKEERFQMNDFIFQNKILEKGKIKTKVKQNKRNNKDQSRYQ